MAAHLEDSQNTVVAEEVLEELATLIEKGLVLYMEQAEVEVVEAPQ